MAETERDWVSETIRSVEAIMDRYGFVPDEFPKNLTVDAETRTRHGELIAKLWSLLSTKSHTK